MQPNQDDFLFSEAEVDEYIRDNFDRNVDGRPACDCLPNLDTYYFLKKSDLELYFQWRTCVRNNDYPPANAKMMVFFFRELAVMNKPLEQMEKWAAFLSKAYKGTEAGDIAYMMHTKFLLSQCRFPDKLEMLATDVAHLDPELQLAGPSIRLGKYYVDGFLDGVFDDPEWAEFFERTLENLSERLWEERDIGIIEYFSNFREERVIDPMEKICDVTRFRFIIDEPVFTEHVFDRLCDIADYCKVLLRPKSGRTPSRIDDITKDSAKKALIQLKGNSERPKEWLPLRTLCVYPNDGRVVRGPYQRKTEPAPMESKARIFDVPDPKADRFRTKDWKPILDKYIGTVPPVESKYVPSPNKCPVFTELGGEQLNYFLHWRSESIKGNYLDTDEGYLSLRILEIAVTQTGEEGMQYLMGLACEYPCYLTKSSCLSFAVTNGLRLPPFSDAVDMGLSDWAVVCIIDALGREPISHIGACTLNHCLGYSISTDYMILDPCEFASVANYLLNRFDRYDKEKKGKRICEQYHKKTVTAHYEIYGHLDRYGLSNERSQKVQNIFDNDHIADVFYVSIMVAMRHVCKKNGSSLPKIDKYADKKLVSQAEEFLKELGS